MSKNPLSYYIFQNILNDNDLIELFERLHSAYVGLLFNNNYVQFNEDFELLLRYADLLSLSNLELHQNIAQQIVILSTQLFPNEIIVKIYKEYIYRNVSNFANLKLIQDKGQLVETDEEFLRELSFYVHKEQNRANNQEDIFLFDAQKKLLNEIGDNQFFSFSAPTSMGKTFIILNHIKNTIKKGIKENFAIVVPTRALLNEIANKIIENFKDFLNVTQYNVVTTTAIIKEDRNYIAVLTPERLYYSLLKTPNVKFNQIFIDEAHKISEKDKRSIIYYKILDMIKDMHEVKVYFSSPVIPNPDIYLELTNFFSIGKSNGQAFLFSPVIQNKIYIDFIDKRIKYVNNLSNNLIDCGDIGNLFQNKYDVIMNLGQNKCNLIYVSSANKAVEYANIFYSKLEIIAKYSLVDPKLEKLSKFIETAIHKEYYLAKLVRRGIAYHIGALPAQIRIKIEALVKERLIRFCFCTSTLLEGINVPADNLFILNYKKGFSSLSIVDAFNLMGRAGRVTLNEFGNVFLIAEDNKYKEYFDDVLLKPIPKQELLPQEALKLKHKKYIIERLLQGKTNLLDIGEKYDDRGFTETTYEYATTVLNILLHDICNDKESYVVKIFKKNNILTLKEISDIKKQFGAIITNDDDVNISAIQKKSLYDYVKDSSIDYPQNFDYVVCVNFLKKLSKIFQWEIYEKETLGKGNRINHYAIILLQWMEGKGMHEIVRLALNYYDQEKLSIVIYDPKWQLVQYNKSELHKNIVINDTLDDIEYIINYKFSMYFLRFSEAIIKVRNLKNISNNWYEYVEYGTNNKLIIQLQKYGLTREIALQIKKNYENYIKSDDEEVRLYKKILYVKDSDLKEALAIVNINFPELFV